jgi:MarR-like DNA-binding transcriptional regulator SgrR of sgrS sRNA
MPVSLHVSLIAQMVRYKGQQKILDFSSVKVKQRFKLGSFHKEVIKSGCAQGQKLHVLHTIVAPCSRPLPCWHYSSWLSDERLLDYYKPASLYLSGKQSPDNSTMSQLFSNFGNTFHIHISHIQHLFYVKL